MKSVAPNCRAMLSLPATVSMAMIRPAPAIAAPLMAARPTPPQPITATVSPGRTFEVWITAPTPVVTPQPISAGAVERHVLADRDAGVLVDQHLLGEGRQVEELVASARRPG